MNDRSNGPLAWVATTICPPSGRAWVRAVLAEASEPPGRLRQAAWSLGAFAVVATVVRHNAARRIPAATYLAALAAVAVGVTLVWLSSTDIEWHGVDDDVCLRLAEAVGGLVALLLTSAAIRIYREPGARLNA